MRRKFQKLKQNEQISHITRIMCIIEVADGRNNTVLLLIRFKFHYIIH